MTATTFLFVVMLCWLTIGVITAFVMARRGHDPWPWGVLGATLGPIVVPVAVAATRRTRSGGKTRGG